MFHKKLKVFNLLWCLLTERILSENTDHELTLAYSTIHIFFESITQNVLSQVKVPSSLPAVATWDLCRVES